MTLHVPFRDRAEAGVLLGESLRSRFGGRSDLVVLALPRGGVPVGCGVARALNVPLDVFLVRKIGVPGYEELAMGAIASGGIRVLNEQVIRSVPCGKTELDRITTQELEELRRREEEYRGGRGLIELPGKAVLLVDDGLATGATMRAAVKAVRALKARQIVVAVPVGPHATCEELSREADEVICLHEPSDFEAVGQYYDNFSQTTDFEVRALLKAAAAN